ncbi:MAG TPA: hypothetical protein VLE53_19090 [Gemmatimonadaceae bacterium]|nr:hypothetical protein [Gemmatimonadaceae bacterium]
MELTTPSRTLRALAALAIGLVFTPSMSAQEPAPKPKEPPTAEKVAEWKAEAEARPLFTSDEVLTFTLTGNFRSISRDRDTMSTKEYWGEILLPGVEGGEGKKLAVQLRTRGHYRLLNRNCGFVPLRLNFQTKAMQGTIFEGQDKLKLITHCNSNAMYDEYVIREYLAYRVHNIVTPRSYRARLARVTYVDSATGRPLETRNGVLLEHEDDVAKRMEGQIAELRGALFDNVDPMQMNEVALFEWFIGNTDWSLYALHNIRLVQQLDGNIMPIAYDLDFSGLVGTRYATPDPRLPIRSVRERLYRGPCRTMEDYEPHLKVYREKEAEILALYESFPGLDSRYRQDTGRFLRDFFGLLKRPADLKVTLVDTCKRQPSV